MEARLFILNKWRAKKRQTANDLRKKGACFSQPAHVMLCAVDTDRAHELKLPTLFICGRYDVCTPEETTRYHRLVDGSNLVILEQSSHSLS